MNRIMAILSGILLFSFIAPPYPHKADMRSKDSF